MAFNGFLISVRLNRTGTKEDICVVSSNTGLAAYVKRKQVC